MPRVAACPRLHQDRAATPDECGLWVSDQHSLVPKPPPPIVSSSRTTHGKVSILLAFDQHSPEEETPTTEPVQSKTVSRPLPPKPTRASSPLSSLPRSSGCSGITIFSRAASRLCSFTRAYGPSSVKKRKFARSTWGLRLEGTRRWSQPWLRRSGAQVPKQRPRSQGKRHHQMIFRRLVTL